MDQNAVQTGQMAPGFTLPRDGGGMVTLSDLRGGKVVLYFYPKDNTPGCTVEALDFTASVAAFATAGTTILGISKDSVKKHDNFVKKQSLGIALLSDEQGSTCEDYGVWGQKSLYGKLFMGIERATFLIGPDGTVLRVWRKVKVPGHVAEVLEAAKTA